MHVKYPRSHSCDSPRARHQMVRSRPSSLPTCTVEFLLLIEKKLPQKDPWTQVSQYFRPTTLDELIGAAQRAWKELSQAGMGKRLVESVPRRLEEVVQTKADRTKY